MLMRLLLALLRLSPLGSLGAQNSAPIPPLDSPVVDTTGTLDAAQTRQLVQQAIDLQQRKGSQLQVLIVPTTQPEDIAQYTTRVFDTWQIGRKGLDDGVLLVVAKDDRRVRIEPGYDLEGAVPDAVANRIIQEYIAPSFRRGDYAGGISEATAVLSRLIEGEALPPPVSAHRQRDGAPSGDGWIIAVVIGFFVGSLLRAVLGWLPRPLRGLADFPDFFWAAILLDDRRNGEWNTNCQHGRQHDTQPHAPALAAARDAHGSKHADGTGDHHRRQAAERQRQHPRKSG